MKNRYLAFFFVSLLLFSCGKVQEQSKPTFPEMRQTTIAGSGNYTLEFHADMPWMLLSSAPWVSFVDNGMKVYDISGYAGDVKVEVEISDNGQTFKDEQDDTDCADRG